MPFWGQSVSLTFRYIAFKMNLHFQWRQFCKWLYVLIVSRTGFRVNPHSIFASMSRNSLLQTGAISEVKVTATGIEPSTTHLVYKWTLNHLTKVTKWLSWVAKNQFNICSLKSSVTNWRHWKLLPPFASFASHS